MPGKTAEILAGLRAVAHPRDRLGRMQLLLLALADRLRMLNCDIGQGYLFSRPLPSDAVTTLLRERAAKGIAEATAA